MANNQKKQGNTKQAPKLVFNGCKFNETKGFYQIPQEAADRIFAKFARKPAYLRLMLVLIGTEPGFGLSVKWITERTGMTQQTYYNTRDELAEMGWLTCENNQVIVNFDKLYGRIESIGQKNSIESIHQKEEEALLSLGIESIHQNSQNKKKSIESIGQMGGASENKGYSLNIPEQYSVNTSKEDLEYSVNTENSIESIHIINKEIDNIDINKLEYITYTEISAIVGGVCWISEDIVQLPNGRYFRVKKEEEPIDWGSMF